MTLLLSSVLLALCGFVLGREWQTYRLRQAAEREALRRRMQAAHDHQICRMLERLPVNEDAPND